MPKANDSQRAHTAEYQGKVLHMCVAKQSWCLTMPVPPNWTAAATNCGYHIHGPTWLSLICLHIFWLISFNINESIHILEKSSYSWISIKCAGNLYT